MASERSRAVCLARCKHQRNHTIRKVVADTRTVTTLAGASSQIGSTDGPSARFNNPQAAAVDRAGNLYGADSLNGTIQRVVVATGVVTTLAGTAGMLGSSDGAGAAARFNTPRGVATDGTGNLYVADTNNGTIRKIQIANATVTTLVGVLGQNIVTLDPVPAGLNQPTAVAALPTGQLFILDENSLLTVR